jgi:hypothetical protein
MPSLPNFTIDSNRDAVEGQVAPPDPSWIAGIYDDADLGDVVIAVTTTSAVVERAPQSASELVFTVATCLEIGAIQAGSCAILQGAECRAPPA